MGKSGILYVVGTGPGSSELMTLGAVRTLQKCPVIFYPVTQSKSGQQKSRALETVKGAVDLGKKILLPLEFSMRKNDSLVYEDAKEKCLAFFWSQQLFLRKRNSIFYNFIPDLNHCGKIFFFVFSDCHINPFI